MNLQAGDARAIAFYLPQFHPIPENDRWWGKGFTEWLNVVKAKPQFPGHYQPHIPADLGFYDLRLPEARQAQAELAREHGVHGFCYYHYWFMGRQLLERPFNNVLTSGQPDFPFCLCWANEHWTRKWGGYKGDILMEQTYSAEDDLRHIRALIPAFKDPRYIEVDGRPLLLVYRINDLPDARATGERWREECVRAGLPGLYLCSVMGLKKLRFDAATVGFDACVDFQPQRTLVWKDDLSGWQRLGRRLKGSDAHVRHMIRDYSLLVERAIQAPRPDYKVFLGVTPGWDNTPRRPDADAYVLANSSPDSYAEWLRAVVRATLERHAGDERIMFINAWNEWAEGNHLEPDQRWGLRYLEETKRALARSPVEERPTFGVSEDR